MMKSFFFLFLIPLFSFGQSNEWENPQMLDFNKEEGRASLLNYASTDAALQEDSAALQRLSLNGAWKFHYVDEIARRPVDFYRTDMDDDQWNTIQVPSNWE